MDESPERRRYYPDEENVPLSTTVREAVAAHEDAKLDPDEIDLYKHVNPEAIDLLFKDTSDADISVQINLSTVTVAIWSDGGVDVRVTEKYE